MQHDQALDARGLACPLPIVKTKKALAAMQSGQVLRVVSTDEGTVQDLPAFAEQMGHALLASEAQADGSHVFYLRKA